MKKSPKGGSGSEEAKIAELHKRIDDLEKALKEKSETDKALAVRPPAPKEPKIEELRAESIVERVVSQFIPGLGGIIKALESSSPEFRKRIAETDAEIKHRIDVGWSSKPVVDFSISTRPMGRGGRTAARSPPTAPVVNITESAPAKEPIVDVLEDKDTITVIADLPGVAEEMLTVDLKTDALEIRSGDFVKEVHLPAPIDKILDKSFKNGILQIRISKQ